MGRASRAQAEENRRQVVDAASHLFRERGVQSVSVADLMAEVGLTHGGFYRQFESKDALLGEATRHAFDIMDGQLTAIAERNEGDADAARRDFADGYLSAAGRDNRAGGCPATGLASDIAREPDADGARAAYAEGIAAFARWMTDAGAVDERTSASAEAVGTAPGEGASADAGVGGGMATAGSSPAAPPSDAGLADVALLVGALTLARATAGTPLSDRILSAARAALG
jgi:TetR/AcrR family transcriptional repressor of nem operon